MTDLFTNPHRYGDLDALAARSRGTPRPRPDPPDRAAGLPTLLGGDRPRRGARHRAATGRVHQRTHPDPRQRRAALDPRRGRRRDPHAHPYGRARSRQVPQAHQRLVQTRERPPLDRPARRAQPPSRRQARGARRRGRLLQRHRARVSAAGHPVDPRPARGRLPEDDQAHPGDVRRRGSRSATRRVVAGADGQRSSWTSTGTSRS